MEDTASACWRGGSDSSAHELTVCRVCNRDGHSENDEEQSHTENITASRLVKLGTEHFLKPFFQGADGLFTGNNPDRIPSLKCFWCQGQISFTVISNLRCSHYLLNPSQQTVWIHIAVGGRKIYFLKSRERKAHWWKAVPLSANTSKMIWVCGLVCFLLGTLVCWRDPRISCNSQTQMPV